MEKEMATHSSVLAWRLPGTGEPGGLPCMGSHRVRHDWSDLAAAAAAAAWGILELLCRIQAPSSLQPPDHLEPKEWQRLTFSDPPECFSQPNLDSLNHCPSSTLNSPLLKPLQEYEYAIPILLLNIHVPLAILLFRETVLWGKSLVFSLLAASNKFFFLLLFGLVVSFDSISTKR